MFAASEAKTAGYGGIAAISQTTGTSGCSTTSVSAAANWLMST
jgi:hypothetical protein